TVAKKKTQSKDISATPGTWTSPISARDLTRGARRFGSSLGDGAHVYWTESRPSEKGRQVIVRAIPGKPAEDVLPKPYSARSRVHEYGGGEFLPAGDTVYFVNAEDQDIWQIPVSSRRRKPIRVTDAPDLRFADMTLDGHRQRLVAVCERHPASPGHVQPQNLIAAVGLTPDDRGRITELATGRDFYAFPRLSPDGRQLAFIAWDLPGMPWDEARLYVAPVRADGTVGRPRAIAGGKGVAAMQPAWLDETNLLYLADSNGFGNLHKWDGKVARAITRLKSELGQPMWQLGSRTFVVAGPDHTIISADDDGEAALLHITNLHKGRPALELKTVPVASLGAIAHYDGGVAAGISRDKTASALVAVTDRRRSPVILRTASDLDLDPRGISVGRTVAFRGGDRKTTYAQLYRPTSSSNKLARGALPPAIILAHGGPTASCGRGLSLRIQYYTSRGFTVLDVDYAGSTGYGRTYRERLDGKWGIADVADCAAGARFLASEGLADGAKIAIAGGSAGGYTVLMALATTTAFSAG
ncbi:MAG: S9 family peptidase, partial [Hyphomicrobiaceae bacterium]